MHKLVQRVKKSHAQSTTIRQLWSATPCTTPASTSRTMLHHLHFRPSTRKAQQHDPRQERIHTSSHLKAERTTSSGSSPLLPLHNLKVLDLSRVLAGPFATQILSDMGATVLKIEHPLHGDETRLWRAQGETGQMWKSRTDVPSGSPSALIATSTSGSVEDSKNKVVNVRREKELDYDMMSLYFCAVNGGKRSLTLDLKTEAGREVVRKLVSGNKMGEEEKTQGKEESEVKVGGYDVVVSNFLPGTLEKLGLGYDVLRSWNERVILAEVSGYGTTGPFAKRAGYDAVALAEAGLLHITGEPDGPPTKPGVAIADLCTGLYMHGAILAAVNARNQNGGMGCRLEGSLFESAVSLLINVGLTTLNLDVKNVERPEQRRRGKRFSCGHPSLVPYNRYKTKDGKWLFIAANNNRQWTLLCEKLGLDTLYKTYGTNDARVNNRVFIDTKLNERFGEQSLEDWLGVFEGSGLPYGPINDVVDALEHPQANARDMVQTINDFEAARDGVLKIIGPAVKFPGTIGNTRGKPPLLGEHTDQVLGELGYGQNQIKRMREDKTV